jgi:hypothetical protein
LLVLTKELNQAGNDSIRKHYNKLFKEMLGRTLTIPGSFDYPFDSLKILMKMTSPDRKFRIYTWSMPKSDGTYDYSGFIQLITKENHKQILFGLKDHSDSIEQPDVQILDADHWYGAQYYRIIMTEYEGRRYYTLLGWHGLNSVMTEKIIEILLFDDQQQPRFGAMLFKDYGNDKLCRVIFKYSATATMLLDYDQQFLPEKKKWNPSRKQFESVHNKTHMIVCDELVPQEPILEGQYEYYIPSSEVFNGFVFMNGYWSFYRNIDARNQ